jgi:glycosyltransferase involved in cell wall biosynthesis
MTLTVLIPVFNTKPHHLIESIMSIINQDDGEKHRIILIDDGSIDFETSQALALFERYGNIEVHHKSNGGTSDALNFGHQLVKTEFVALQGSDDISHRSRFSKQIAYLKENRSIDVLSTNLFSYYDDDITRTAIWSSKMEEKVDKPYGGTSNWFANHGTVIYRQEAVMNVGGYNVNFRRGQDTELWKRMKENGARFRCVQDKLYAWRRYR